MQLISRTTTHKHLVEIVTTNCITDKELLQKAWTLANESYLGPLCVLFAPSEIVIGCLEIAAMLLDYRLNDTSDFANPVIIVEIIRGTEKQVIYEHVIQSIKKSTPVEEGAIYV